MKKGIALVSLVVVVIVLTIITGMITMGGVSSVKAVNLNKFALEILDIQTKIDEYYFKYGAFPIGIDTVFSTQNIDDNTIKQFEKETITNGNITFKTIDIQGLGLNESFLGNNKYENDQYVLSHTTGKVYYLRGVDYDDKVYYTLTDDLLSAAKIENITSSDMLSSDEIKVKDIIFKPSTIAYTNVAIEVMIKIPVSITVNSITTTNDKSINNETIQGKYKIYIVNQTSQDRTGNYEITVNYTYNGEENTATYEVTTFDNIKPTISVTENKENGLRKINITAEENESGIKYVKYAETEIQDATFFVNNGKVINGNELVLDEDKAYTIYVQDKAGNNTVLNQKTYAIYSSTDNSLTFIRSGAPVTVGSTYNNKDVTAVYTDFIDDLGYDSANKVPWYNFRTNITSVMVEDPVRPNGVAYWFSEFNNCSTLDVTKLDTSNVDMTLRTFNSCGKNVNEFKIVGLDSWDVSKVKNMGWMFADAGRDAKEFDIGNLSGWNTQSATSFYSMFSNAGKSAKEFNLGNLGNWKTSNVGYFRSMFIYTGNVAETWYIGDISSWDSSKVKDFGQIFHGAGSKSKEFNIGDIGKWNMSNATSIYEMFYYSGQYSEHWYIGDLSNWDMSNVSNMNGVFGYAGSSTKNWSVGDISKWNTSNVTSMNKIFESAGQNSEMFYLGDISTKQVQKEDGTTYTAWDVSKVESMYAAFSHAGENSKTWYIGAIGNWNTSKVSNMSAMFGYAGVSADWSLDLSNWNVGLVTAYTNFNLGVESKVTPPNFVATQ